MMHPVYLPNGQKCEGEGLRSSLVTHGSVKLVDRTEFGLRKTPQWVRCLN